MRDRLNVSVARAAVTFSPIYPFKGDFYPQSVSYEKKEGIESG